MRKMKEEGHGKKSEIKKGMKFGFLSGFLASLCCVGPLIIILFGLGTFSFALSITQYGTYFLLLGFLTMSSAIFLHLRKKNKTCDFNCFSIEGLKREKHFILSIILTMGIIYVLILYVVIPSVAPSVYGTNSPNADLLDENSDIYKLIVKIEGMTCVDCVYIIENILYGLDGIVEVEIRYPEGSGEIIYDSNIISVGQIINSEAFTLFSADIIGNEKLEK